MKKGEESVVEQLGEVLTPDKKEKKNLISLLQEIQEKLGYLPKEAMRAVASFLEMPAAEVYSVATFYNQFRLTPIGSYPIQVCLGTACHLRGGELILKEFERKLGIKVGETSEDGNFSLERVACVGCCMLAPVVKIGDRTPTIKIGNKIYSKMTTFKVDETLVPYKQEIDRQSSEERQALQ
jgi:NADH-quinone oxidoreductase subunit E